MDKDIFYTVRGFVSAEDAAKYYGLRFQKDAALCPFHADQHASMTFKEGFYRCWVCNIGGDAVDLVSRLFGLSPIDAVKRLNYDFALNLPLDNPVQRQEIQRHKWTAEIYHAYELWKSQMINRLNAAFRVAHIALRDKSPENMTTQEVLAVQCESSLEYWSDILSDQSLDEQMTIFRQKERIETLCNRILLNMQKKSGMD